MEPKYNINLNFGFLNINFGPTPGDLKNAEHASKSRNKSRISRNGSKSVLRPFPEGEKTYEFVCPYYGHQECYFTSKLELRDHLRCFHGEDIITHNVVETTPLDAGLGKDESLPDPRLRQATHKLDPYWFQWSWWTCANCFAKVNVETEGWLCKNGCASINHPNKDESSVDANQWIAERRIDPRWTTWDTWTCIICFGKLTKSWDCTTCRPSYETERTEDPATSTKQEDTGYDSQTTDPSPSYQPKHSDQPWSRILCTLCKDVGWLDDGQGNWNKCTSSSCYTVPAHTVSQN